MRGDVSATRQPEMSFQNHFKYAFRRVARENWISEGRATALQNRERLTPSQRDAETDRLLHASMTQATLILPAYAHLRGKLPSTGLADFLRRSLPVISKAELLAERERYYPRLGKPQPWWNVGKTSGTTGTPLEVFRSYDSTLWEHAFHLQHWRWAGHRGRERQVVLRGDLVVPVLQSRPPFWFHDRLGQQLFVSTRHLNDATAPQIAEAIAAFGARQLRAYPSAAFELARLAELHQLSIRFGSIITGSETLYPVQRERIERVLGGKVFDFYGMAERNIFGMQCEHGRMHISPDYSLVEIVDAQGAPTDQAGLLVGSTFHNRVMPLLRYQLNDSARWAQCACPCGRSYPVVEGLSGKVEEQVFDLDGVPVSPSVITFAFKGIHNIQKSQVVQTEQDRWLLRIVPGPHYSAADRQALLGNFKTLVSPRLNVDIETVSAISNMASGKYKWVSQQWRPQAADSSRE